MPTYNTTPSADDILKRTRGRISTARGGLMALASSARIDADERARQVANNLEKLLDPAEVRQVMGIFEHAAEFDAKLAELRAQAERFVLKHNLNPEREARMRRAVERFLASEISSGMYFSNRIAE